MDLLQKLQGYYRSKGIAAAKHFRCPYFKDCKGRSKKFVEASEAFVGSCYQHHKTPRLLFISASPGINSHWTLQDRTVYGQRKKALARDVIASPQNKHWPRTCQLALEIMRKFNSKIKDVNRVQDYFAHTDVAKCCQNKRHGKQPDARLFNNCSQFIAGEIEILNPDILITQGREAYKSIKDTFEKLNRRRYLNKGKKKFRLFNNFKVISIRNRPVLWISTYHPNSHGDAFTKQRKKWPIYAGIVEDFIVHN